MAYESRENSKVKIEKTVAGTKRIKVKENKRAPKVKGNQRGKTKMKKKRSKNVKKK